MAERYVDVSSLRTVDSGTCVDTSPASAVRCTISVLRVELRRIVLRAHVINDTEEAIRCAPGVKRGSTAQVQTDLDLICDPHAEMGFLFALPRFAPHPRSAFVRVEATSFACGFTCELDDEGRTLAIVAVAGIAAVVVAAAVVGVVLYERNRRRKAAQEQRPETTPPVQEPEASPQTEPIIGEVVEEPQPTKTSVPAETELTQAIGQYQFGTTTPQEARGFAAVVGEERVVMGAVECMKRRFASSEFVAKVVNQANEPLLCTVSGRTRRGPAFVAPGYFWVHPQSAAAITIAAPLRLPWRLRTIALQMQNSALRASAEADVPTPPLVRAAAAAAALIVLLLVATFAFRAVRPNIEAFALPPEVLAGNSVTASYGISGVGTARYDVTYRGTHVASGMVPSGNGTFAFVTGRHPGSYHVALSFAGPFGSSQQSLLVDAVSHLTPIVATIDTLEVDPEVVNGGKPVTVRYIAHAQSGTVTLLDAAQIPLQTVAYDQQGSSVLTAPRSKRRRSIALRSKSHAAHRPRGPRSACSSSLRTLLRLVQARARSRESLRRRSCCGSFRRVSSLHGTSPFNCSAPNGLAVDVTRRPRNAGRCKKRRRERA